MSDNIERIAVFDFDGTLYKKNSILSFCYFYYCKKPLRLWRIFMQLFAWGLWKTKRINTKTMEKETPTSKKIRTLRIRLNQKSIK